MEAFKVVKPVIWPKSEAVVSSIIIWTTFIGIVLSGVGLIVSDNLLETRYDLVKKKEEATRFFLFNQLVAVYANLGPASNMAVPKETVISADSYRRLLNGEFEIEPDSNESRISLITPEAYLESAHITYEARDKTYAFVAKANSDIKFYETFDSIIQGLVVTTQLVTLIYLIRLTGLQLKKARQRHSR